MPFESSVLIPTDLLSHPESALGDVQQKLVRLSLLADDINRLSSSVLACLSAGGVLMMVTLVSFCSLVYGYPTRLRRGCEVIGPRILALLFFAMGLLCCTPFVMLVGIQNAIVSKAGSKSFSSWMAVERGQIFPLSVVSLVASVFFTTFCAGTLAINQRRVMHVMDHVTLHE